MFSTSYAVSRSVLGSYIPRGVSKSIFYTAYRRSDDFPILSKSRGLRVLVAPQAAHVAEVRALADEHVPLGLVGLRLEEPGPAQEVRREEAEQRKDLGKQGARGCDQNFL